MKKIADIKKLLILFCVSLMGMVFAQNKTNILETPVKLEWDPPATIEASYFEEVKAGFILSLSYKNEKADYHQIKIYAGDWSPLTYGIVKGAENEGGALIPDKNSGTITYTITARDVSHLRKSGLLFHGFGMKITKISCEPAPVVVEKNSTKKIAAPKFDIKPNPKPEFASGTPFAQHGPLTVKGSNIYDKNGNKYMLYGMSTHGISWFPQYVNKAALKTLRDDWNTNCFRIALYPRENMGYCAGGDKEQLKNLVFKGIDAATELGMYVIVDWHVLNYNPNELTAEAMAFLCEISQKYGKYENVIYELCNEPTNAPWDSAIKPYAENLIPAIRKNAPNSLIIVGTNTWSQDIEGPLANPLKYKNVMYSFHFYADTHRDSFRERVETAVKAGLPIFVTEFGTCNSSGNGGFNVSQSNKWFDLLKEYNISHMNWSICNKAETASIIAPDCNKLSDWNYEELTESGKLIYTHFNQCSR